MADKYTKFLTYNYPEDPNDPDNDTVVEETYLIKENPKIHYAVCSTAAATAAKTIDLEGFVLDTGSWIAVKFTITNTAAVANLTLNVNSTGAKNIKYRNANLGSAGYLAANRIYLMLYDGTYWQIVGDINTNDNTYDRTSMQTRIYAGGVGVFPYSLCALDINQRVQAFTTTGGTGTSKVFNTTAKFLYPPTIMYHYANETKADGAVVTNNVLYEQFPSANLTYSCNITTSAGFAQYKPVYLEASFNDDGTWSPTTTGLTQTFTSGKYYILIGCMYSTSIYQLCTFAHKPMFYYNGTTLIGADKYVHPAYTPAATPKDGHKFLTWDSIGSVTGGSSSLVRVDVPADKKYAAVFALWLDITGCDQPISIDVVQRSLGPYRIVIRITKGDYGDLQTVSIDEFKVLWDETSVSTPVTHYPKVYLKETSSDPVFRYRLFIEKQDEVDHIEVVDSNIGDWFTSSYFWLEDTEDDIATDLQAEVVSYVYTHPTYTSRSSGLYKITVNNTGHVSDVANVAKTDVSALINLLDTNSSTPVDADYYISQYVNGGTSTTTYQRRPMSALWSYVKGKADLVYADINHTHPTSIATDSGTNQLTMAASTKYKITTGGTNYIFTTPPDTKNTTGSTDTSSKIFLIGATSQAANPQTYSDNEVFTTSGVLTTKKVQVGGGSCTMEYNTTTQSLDFVFT